MKSFKNSLVLALAILATLLVAFLLPAAFSSLETGVVVAELAHAQNGEGSYQFLEPIPGVGEEIDVSSTSTFPTFVQNIITLVIGFAILAAIIMIVVAGFEYITTTKVGGNENAKKRIQNAVLGLVLALASVVILQTINPQLIELKTVSSVTTSGESFIISDFSEFGGSIHPAGNDDDGLPDTHGNKHCFFIDGEASFKEWLGITGDNDDRFACFQQEDQCVDGREKAVEIEDTGGGGVGTDCEYYFEATAIVAQDTSLIGGADYWDIDGNGKADQVRIQRADPDKDTALGKCIAQVSEAGATHPSGIWDSFETWVDSWIQGENTEITKDMNTYCINGPVKVCSDLVQPCTLTTEEEPEKPLPDNWDIIHTCPVNVASDNSNFCKLEMSTCETQPSVDACYASPTLMFGSEVSGCHDCVFISDIPGLHNTDLSSKFKYGEMCSGNPAYCRLNGKLVGELNTFNQAAIENEFDYEITEVFPPTVKHANNCHYNGTCVDIGVRPPDIRDGSNYDLKISYISAVVSAADKASMKACYEVNTTTEQEAILSAAKNSGIDSLNSGNVVYVDVGVNHFSVYENENEPCKG